MSNFENAEPAPKNLRSIAQDPAAPELRALKAEVHAVHQRIDGVEARLDQIDGRLDSLEQALKFGFENVARQLDVYKDVQLLRERMLRLELERSPKPNA